MLLPILAFVLMIVVGAVHGVFVAVPTIGYGTALLAILGVDLLAYLSKQFRK